jgi:hypothetical protein
MRRKQRWRETRAEREYLRGPSIPAKFVFADDEQEARFVFAHRRLGLSVYVDTKNDKLVVLGMRPQWIDGRLAFVAGPFLFTQWPRRFKPAPKYTTPVDEQAAERTFIADWREAPKYSTVVIP